MNTNLNSVSNFAGPEFPTGVSAQDKLGHAVKHATLATPLDEWQPWQFQVGDGFVELFAHAGRITRTDDALERELIIRCGTALKHLKLALKYFGCLGRIELFPDLAQPGLVARIHQGSSHRGGMHEAEMFEAMGQEKSATLNEAPLTESFLALFQDSLAGEKAWLEFSQSESSRSRLVALAESGPGTHKPGLHRHAPPENLKVAQWARPLLTFVVRSGDPGKFTVEAGGRRAEEMAALAVIKTKTDDKHGWLATGLAIAHARLKARTSEISARVFDQAFRNWRVREELRTSIGHKGFAQAIIGFGLQSAQWDESSDQPLDDFEVESDSDFPRHFRHR